MRILLSSKLHRGTITQCDLNYEGSCDLGPDLLKASGLLPLEKIALMNINTGSRLETYVIRADKNGEISLNGAAARQAAPGDTARAPLIARSQARGLPRRLHSWVR